MMLWRISAMAAATCALIACAPNCPENDGPFVLYREDFEDLCSGAPCGWAVLQGSAGSVTTVMTIHAGETGLSFNGDGLLVRSDDAGNLGPNGTITFPLQLRVSGRCDMGSSLNFQVLTKQPATNALIAYTTTPELPDDWQGAIDANMRRTDNQSELFDGAGRRVERIDIFKTGSGRCEIDNVEIGDATREARSFCD